MHVQERTALMCLQCLQCQRMEASIQKPQSRWEWRTPKRHLHPPSRHSTTHPSTPRLSPMMDSPQTCQTPRTVNQTAKSVVSLLLSLSYRFSRFSTCLYISSALSFHEKSLQGFFHSRNISNFTCSNSPTQSLFSQLFLYSSHPLCFVTKAETSPAFPCPTLSIPNPSSLSSVSLVHTQSDDPPHQRSSQDILPLISAHIHSVN